MAPTKEDVAAIVASVPVRSVSGPETPTRVDIPQHLSAHVVHPSSQEIRASVPELVELGARIARIEGLLDESAKERLIRKGRDEGEAERRKLLADEEERRRVEADRKAKTLGQYVAITTALLTTLGSIAVQLFNAAQAGK